MALFVCRPHQCVWASSLPASENLHNSGRRCRQEECVMRQIRSRSVAAAILIAAVLSLAGPARAVADEIDQMRLAAHQLAGAQLSSGLLDFDIDFLAGQGVGSGDTDIERTAFIARQADAAYVLAKYLASSKDTSVSAAVQRLIVTLGSLSLPV